MALGEWGGEELYTCGAREPQSEKPGLETHGLSSGQEGLPTWQSFVLSGTFLETDLCRGSVEESGL